MTANREAKGDRMNEGITFEQYQDEMVAYAKEVQGDNYAGDDYYRQNCWKEFWQKRSPQDAVIEDMGYWEPAGDGDDD